MSIVYRNTEISDNFQKVFGPPPKEMSDPDTPYPASTEQRVAVNAYLQYAGQWRGLMTYEALAAAGHSDIVSKLENANSVAYVPWGLGPVVLYVMEIAGKREVHQSWPHSAGAHVYMPEFMDWRPFHEGGLDFNAEAHIMDVQSRQIEHGRAVLNPYPKLGSPTKAKNDKLLEELKKQQQQGMTAIEDIPLKT